MDRNLSRREFLKLGGLGLSSLASQSLRVLLPPEEKSDPVGVARVTISEIGVYKEPDLKSDRLEARKRDELVNLFEEIISPNGPPLNPRWYRVVGGYTHSAYLQRVDNASPNIPVRHIPGGGRLGEITMPYVQSMQLTAEGWSPVYRLYYQSVHWVTGIEIGPDGQPWYRLKDELLRLDYHVPATHVRLLDPEEVSPISPDVPPGRKWIDVSLRDQTLTAYEDGEIVLHTQISSGLPSIAPIGKIPTDTPKGQFFIDPKMPSKHMGDGRLTAEIGAYELPGVPWVCFFEFNTGVAFHGTYWHDNFGARMSRGCVNMRPGEARWLYRWSNPPAQATDWNRGGFGTRVTVY
jgi:lipoprotein-anchoring transpeptidase ErfK/SrfK